MIKFYQVGGSVRDKFLGQKSKDIDYSVEAPSYEAMRAEIIRRGGQIYLETPEYFTIRAKMPGMGDADFVLCRKDGDYSDNRRPDTVTVGTLYDDLSRRDFTMNAIAIAEDGTVIDPFGGEIDISRRLICCVGKPADRFNEDYLRILRAVRFSITKEMGINPDILDFFTNDYIYKIIDSCAEDRIRDEFMKMFRASTYATLKFMHKYPAFYILFNRDETNLWLKPTSEKP